MEYAQTRPRLRLKAGLKPRVQKGRLVLLQPLLQRARLEPVLQKAAELGVGHIALFVARRGVATWAPEERQAKLKRAELLLHEASRQCGLNPLPGLSCWGSLGEALAAVDPGLPGFFLWEDGEFGGRGASKAAPGLRVCVGPEGGFSAEELQVLGEGGLLPRRLGTLILRSETASVVALTLANLELGRWGADGASGGQEDL
jgi:16S rRNA (uracil1498-N3)-methyltransferase